MRVPIPRERLQGPQEPRATAPNVVPMRDYTGQQTQELGQSVERAGLMTSAVGARLRERHDAAASKSGVAAYQDGVRKDLETPESGYLRRIGKDAVDGRQSTIEAIEKRRRAVRDSLENDDQRAIFDAQTEGITQRALSYIDDHYVKQSTAWDIGESEAIIGSESGAYASNWTDPAAAAESRAVILDQTNHIADLNGLPKDSEQRKALVLHATTRMHLGAIARMIDDGKASEATAYYEQHKGEIGQEAQAKATSALRTHGKHQELVRAYDSVAAAGLNPIAQIDYLDKLKLDPEDRKRVHGWLTDLNKQRADAIASVGSQALAEAKNWRLTRGEQPLPQSILSRLEQGEALDDFDEWVQGGGADKTNETGREYLTMSQDELRRTFRSQEALVRTLSVVTSTADLKNVLSTYNAKGDDVNVNESAKAELLRRGVDIEKDAGKSQLVLLNDAVRGYIARNKKPMTDESVREALDYVYKDTLAVSGEQVPIALLTNEQRLAASAAGTAMLLPSGEPLTMANLAGADDERNHVPIAATGETVPFQDIYRAVDTALVTEARENNGYVRLMRGGKPTMVPIEQVTEQDRLNATTLRIIEQEDRNKEFHRIRPYYQEQVRYSGAIGPEEYSGPSAWEQDIARQEDRLESLRATKGVRSGFLNPMRHMNGMGQEIDQEIIELEANIARMKLAIDPFSRQLDVQSLSAGPQPPGGDSPNQLSDVLQESLSGSPTAMGRQRINRLIADYADVYTDLSKLTVIDNEERHRLTRERLMKKGYNPNMVDDVGKHYAENWTPARIREAMLEGKK